MKAAEQYFPVVLFIMLHMVVFTFDPVYQTLMSDHWTHVGMKLLNSYCSVLSSGVMLF